MAMEYKRIKGSELCKIHNTSMNNNKCLYSVSFITLNEDWELRRELLSTLPLVSREFVLNSQSLKTGPLWYHKGLRYTLRWVRPPLAKYWQHQWHLRFEKMWQSNFSQESVNRRLKGFFECSTAAPLVQNEKVKIWAERRSGDFSI